jgi:TRAP-type C4-dicarboxylate transport system permease small subunit
VAVPPPSPGAAEPQVDSPRPTFPRLRRLDAAWYRAELWLCGFMFLSMALIVFLGVVRDVFGTRHDWVDALVLFALLWLGAQTRLVRAGEAKRSPLVNVVIAAIVTAAIGGLVELYVTLLPGGFPWAPKMALCLMLWVAFLGASMATYEKAHIALEVGEKLWPKSLQRWIKTLAHFITTAFCVVLFVLSIMSLSGAYETWDATDGHGAIVPTLDWLPQWVVFIIFPYVFLAMAVRFAAQTVTIATHKDEPPPSTGEAAIAAQETS